jgi:hypothetical protein
MPNRCTLFTALAASAMVGGCGSSDTQAVQQNSTRQNDAGAQKGDATAIVTGDISVPNVTAGTNFSFDVGAVDSVAHRYYLADRNNKGVDVVDTTTNTFVKTITGGFAGCNTSMGVPSPDCSTVSNTKSGPNGVIVLPGTNFIYVGDLNAVQVIDKTTDTVVKTIPVSTAGFRADEGCFDPDHNLFMITSPDEMPPFAAFIDTTAQAVVAKVTFNDATGGLEQCAYDHGTQSFFINNDATTANPHGELDVLPAASVAAIAPGGSVNYATLPGFKMSSEGNCDPSGLALGPGNDLAVDCRPGAAGSAMNVLIFDRTSGALLATVNGGGGDQIAYDSISNRFLVAASRWTASGVSNPNAACNVTTPCTPVLNVIDAASRTVVARVPTGNNSHSVAIDGPSHQVYDPYSSAALPAGAVTGASFAGGGISVVLLQ